MARKIALDCLYQTLRTSGTLLKASHRFFRQFGLTEAQFNVLNVLEDKPDGMSQRQLSDVLVVDRSNVTGLLDRMEAAGWVERKRAPNDRRAYRVVLTRSGTALIRRVLPKYEAAVAELFRGLDPEAARRACEFMTQLEQRADILLGQ